MKKKKIAPSSLVRRLETPEDALWRNVITQAIQDATLRIHTLRQSVFSEQMAVIRDQAREWIAKQGEDFHLVCSLAGLEADRVHAFAMAQIEKAIQAQHELTATENFLKGSHPGVVADIAEGVADRPTPTAQKREEIDFSQNRELPPCP